MARALLIDGPYSAVVEELIAGGRGRPVVVVMMHSLGQARRIADEAALFWIRDGAGRLIEAGSVEAIDAPRDPLHMRRRRISHQGMTRGGHLARGRHLPHASAMVLDGGNGLEGSPCGSCWRFQNAAWLAAHLKSSPTCCSWTIDALGTSPA